VLNCWAKMEDMQGIVKILPPAGDLTIDRLNRALDIPQPTATATSAELLAKRDALLAVTGEAA